MEWPLPENQVGPGGPSLSVPGVQVKGVSPPREGVMPSPVLINSPPPCLFAGFITQSCPTLGDPGDCSVPGSSVQGIFFSGKDTGVGFHFLLQPPPTGPSQIEGQRLLLRRDHTLDPLLGRKSSSPLSPLSPSSPPDLLWGSVGPPAPCLLTPPLLWLASLRGPFRILSPGP